MLVRHFRTELRASGVAGTAPETAARVLRRSPGGSARCAGGRSGDGKDAGSEMNISSLEIFADALKAKFSLPGCASPEDQLKPVVADLLKSAGTAYGLAVDTRTETHLSGHKVRPDIAVYVGGLICGYVELKAPNLGADAPKLKGEHNKKQWEKLKGLPNLIYTDGREWALYRGGERPDGQPIVRLHDDPTEKGKAATTKADAEGLERLFRDFLGWQP